MCRRVQCPTCDRPTFSGCGNHVDLVLGDVAPADRCQCTGTGRSTGTGPGTPWSRPARGWLRSRSRRRS